MQHCTRENCFHVSSFWKHKANIQQASLYWINLKNPIIGHDRVPKSSIFFFVKHTNEGFKRHYCNARKCRGRKITPLVAALHADLGEKFNRMRKAGFKFNGRLLRQIALLLIFSKSKGLHDANTIDNRSKNLIKNIVTHRWVQKFMKRSRIVNRA